MGAVAPFTLMAAEMHCWRGRATVWDGWCAFRLVEKTNLACYEVRDDGSDGCRVCFTAQEYAIGENATQLDGSLLRITEVSLPDSANRSTGALYHRNRGYVYVEFAES
jgi:hypothetical protein